MSVKWTDVLNNLKPMIQAQYNLIGGYITIRRAFYIAVSAGLIPNTQNYYITLSSQLARARENGTIPWEWLDDDHRSISKPIINPSSWYGVDSPLGAMDDPTEEQGYYVEVWIEKAGSIPIVEPLCKEYYVKLISTAGRASVSYKYHAAQRFKAAIDRGQKVKLLYISDLDADGEHFPTETKAWMERIRSVAVDVEKILLTLTQVNTLNLPVLNKNYTKRLNRNVVFVRNFVAQYGNIQVELDAMPIPDIRSTLEKHLKKYIDMSIIKRVKEESVVKATQNIQKELNQYTKSASLTLITDDLDRSDIEKLMEKFGIGTPKDKMIGKRVLITYGANDGEIGTIVQIDSTYHVRFDSCDAVMDFQEDMFEFINDDKEDDEQ